MPLPKAKGAPLKAGKASAKSESSDSSSSDSSSSEEEVTPLAKKVDNPKAAPSKVEAPPSPRPPPPPSQGAPPELTRWLKEIVHLPDFSDEVAEALLKHYGCREAMDLQYLGEKDIEWFLKSQHFGPKREKLKTAPAGKLMDAWKKVANKVTDVDQAHENDGDFSYIDHARRLLTQVYYRQNMYVKAAQYYDSHDLSKFLTPIIIFTSFASICSFFTSASFIDAHPHRRSLLGFGAGLGGVVSTLLVTLRNTVKYDCKAETFRNAAGQYRILATKLEHRIALHRHQLNEIDLGKADFASTRERHLKEKEEMVHFFNDTYARIITCQSEMPHMVPVAKVKLWRKLGLLRPNPVDQPMTKLKSPGYRLSEHEKERSLYLMSNGDVDFDTFRKHPETLRVMREKRELVQSIEAKVAAAAKKDQ